MKYLLLFLFILCTIACNSKKERLIVGVWQGKSINHQFNIRTDYQIEFTEDGEYYETFFVEPERKSEFNGNYKIRNDSLVKTSGIVWKIQFLSKNTLKLFNGADELDLSKYK